MSCSTYKTISSVQQAFQITYTEANFVKEIPFSIPDYFREDLAVTIQDGVVNNSEFAICANLIHPILKLVWKEYRQHFVLWSHQALSYDEYLSGFPEYILAGRSPLGKLILEKPYLLLVEAKQDKFEEGWAECLAEMIAAQRLNEKPQLTILGIVSNGKAWEFGKLEGQHFTRNTTFYTIQQMDELLPVINYIFQDCISQLEIWLEQK